MTKLEAGLEQMPEVIERYFPGQVIANQEMLKLIKSGRVHLPISRPNEKSGEFTILKSDLDKTLAEQT